MGQKFANELLYKSDYILFLGCRLGESFIGRNPRVFAPDVLKCAVSLELDTENQGYGLKNLKVFKEDLRTIVPNIEKSISKVKLTSKTGWIETCIQLKNQELAKLRGDRIDGYGDWNLRDSINALSSISGRMHNLDRWWSYCPCCQSSF